MGNALVTFSILCINFFYDCPLTYLKLKYKYTSLRACLCPAFALPLPCLCPAFALPLPAGRRQAGGRQAAGRRQAGGRQAAGRQQAGGRQAAGRRQAGSVFYDEAIYSYSEK